MYSFQGLLSEEQTPKGKVVSGPMGPFMGAQEFAKEMDIHVHGLVRINFGLSFPQIHSEEGIVHQDFEPAVYDTLVIMTRWNNKGKHFKQYGMMIDMGTESMGVCTWFDSDPISEMIVTPVYEDYEKIQKMTREELEVIMQDAGGKGSGHFDVNYPPTAEPMGWAL